MSPNKEKRLLELFPYQIGSQYIRYRKGDVLRFDHDDGWEQIVELLLRRMDHDCRLYDIRETHGILVIDLVYKKLRPNYAEKNFMLKLMAMALSRRICDICGSTGAELVHIGGRPKTRCKDHCELISYETNK